MYVRACCSQITVSSVEEIDILKEEVMSSPVLLRVWAEFIDNDYIGAAQLGPRFEGIATPADSSMASILNTAVDFHANATFIRLIDCCRE